MSALDLSRPDPDFAALRIASDLHRALMNAPNGDMALIAEVLLESHARLLGEATTCDPETFERRQTVAKLMAVTRVLAEARMRPERFTRVPDVPPLPPVGLARYTPAEADDLANAVTIARGLMEAKYITASHAGQTDDAAMWWGFASHLNRLLDRLGDHRASKEAHYG